MSDGSLTATSIWRRPSCCGLGRALAHALRAVLDVEELVAHPLVALDVDARAELAGLRRARHAGDRVGLGRRHHGGLAAVADGVRVRDVVARHVERQLLGEDAPQGGLEAEECGDGHRLDPRVDQVEDLGPRARSLRRRSTHPRACPTARASGGRGRRAPAGSARGSARGSGPPPRAVPRSSAERARACTASSPGSSTRIISSVRSLAGRRSAVEAWSRSTSRSRSSCIRRPISCCTSARRASTLSTSCARMASRWAITVWSRRRAEASWRSRWSMSPVMPGRP